MFYGWGWLEELAGSVSRVGGTAGELLVRGDSGAVVIALSGFSR
jgi:hypothetical protein